MKPRKAPKVSELETEMAKTQGRGSVDRFHAISSTEWFRITEYFHKSHINIARSETSTPGWDNSDQTPTILATAGMPPKSPRRDGEEEGERGHRAGFRDGGGSG
jgi:hypothetical protein